MTLKTLFYHLKPIVPRYLQIFLRRKLIASKLTSCNSYWPIDESAGIEPLIWHRWPLGKRFALILTHDVEKNLGQERCVQLMNIEKKHGFVSSFNFVPERYMVSETIRKHLVRNGFEVGVHDLNHDGKLFSSRKIFQYRSQLINHYLNEWQSVGFRAAAMHHNLNWIGELNIEYDCSTFDTDPFEPQPDGVGTIFPFLVTRKNRSSFVEMPYTLPQDFTLFILMKNQTVDVWKRKIEWIVQRGGMALINVHPDYINFGDKPNGTEEYLIDYYKEFLQFIKSTYSNEYWNVLPKELARYISSVYV